MALRSPALWMGNPAVQHTAQNDRLLLSSLLRAETGQTAANRPLTAASGVLQGPPGTMGEVTVLSNTQFTVNPARWWIYSSASALGGSYQVTNDALATLGITAQNATQFRRSYWGVWVTDSFVAGSGDDLPHWGLVDGALAASAAVAALPSAGALPANFLALGEFLIPPTGQNVTYTPYDLATGLRGSIVPTTTTDTRAGSHVGSYRDRPDVGLQRWNGTGWQSLGLGGDTGWVNYNNLLGAAVSASTPPANAVTQNVYRVRNGMATVLVNLGYNGAWAVDFAIANLPAICAPAYAFYFVGISYSGNSFNLYVDRGGVLRVANAITTNGLLASVTYPTG